MLVAIGLTAAVKLGWLSTDVTRATDVGMSYGAAAVLGALTAAIPRRWRPVWIGWWLAVAVGVIGIGKDFTDVGHATALMLGMLVATRFGAPARWTVARWVLLVVGAGFGFLMVAGSGLALIVATSLGLAGAAFAEVVVGRRRARDEARRPVGAEYVLTPGIA